MSTFAWYGLQFVVAMTVFVFIGETFGLQDRGLAPAFVSMTAAWMVTELVSKLVDWRKSFRGVAVGQELKRHGGGSLRSLRHASNGPQLIGRARIGQDRRKLTKIAP